MPRTFMHRFRRRRVDGRESIVWDRSTTKPVLIATIFLALGLLISWQSERLWGRDSGFDFPDKPEREAQYWSQIQFLNPQFDSSLKDQTIEMGWRVCTKLEAGWSHERIVSYISQPPTRWDTNEENEKKKLPMLSGQLLFWTGLEQSAGRSLCPEAEQAILEKTKSNEERKNKI